MQDLYDFFSSSAHVIKFFANLLGLVRVRAEYNNRSCALPDTYLYLFNPVFTCPQRFLIIENIRTARNEICYKTIDPILIHMTVRL